MTNTARRLEKETEREPSPWEVANKKDVNYEDPYYWKRYDCVYNGITEFDMFKPLW